MTDFAWALLALFATTTYALCCFVAAFWTFKDFGRKE